MNASYDALIAAAQTAMRNANQSIEAGQSVRYYFEQEDGCLYITHSDLPNIEPTPVPPEPEPPFIMKDINLSEYIASAVNHRSGSGSNYCVTISGLLADIYAPPETNNQIAQNVTALPDTLGVITGSYNSIYNAGISTSTISRGIGVKTDGELVVYIDGMQRTGITAWLAENNLVIRYKALA